MNGRGTSVCSGAGRWGTNNPGPGIPVTYGEIHNASVLVEIAAGQLMPELSHGTHFCGDLLATDSFYLPGFPDQGDRVNEDWILAQPNATDDSLVHLVTLEEGSTTTFDGHVRKAAVYL